MTATNHRDFLGVGWSYPVGTDPFTGDTQLSRYERDVKEAIRIVLETRPGERVMRPRFGCGIHELVFEEMSVTVLHAVEKTVRDALITYEARIELIDVTVDAGQADSGCLIIRIIYRLRRTNQEDNLVYPFFFLESREA